MHGNRYLHVFHLCFFYGTIWLYCASMLSVVTGCHAKPRTTAHFGVCSEEGNYHRSITATFQKNSSYVVPDLCETLEIRLIVLEYFKKGWKVGQNIFIDYTNLRTIAKMYTWQERTESILWMWRCSWLPRRERGLCVSWRSLLTIV